MTLLRELFDSLFSCWHRQYGWPRQDDEGDMYVVCRDCGEHLPYDWDLMKVVKDRSYYAVTTGTNTVVSVEYNSVCGADVGGSVSAGSRVDI